ncbi:hypothetical protein WSS_A21963 [Rhodococcus opacus M213]|uniref:Uncharacterized protein n=1 Tax=Rhodococcus opacus M213 TaxID=1129896 RepID=K8XTU7_RHOOP|nr:hypothetical protein [Rhodococcus opacus]EKT80485.1 hypothetical protein WSS_A21963 [Rhodococcus opacus M213]
MATEKPHTICMRASDDDRVLIAAVADAMGLSVSAFLRETVLDLCAAYVDKHGAGFLAAKAAEAEEERQRKRKISEKNLLRISAGIDRDKGLRF